jgi:four helix bundle protein
VTDALPKSVVGRHVGRQLLRCGTSAGANYAEGQGAESRADFIHKLAIVLKELKESVFWISVAHRARLIDPRCLDPLLDEANQLIRMVAKSIITAKGKGEPPGPVRPSSEARHALSTGPS